MSRERAAGGGDIPSDGVIGGRLFGILGNIASPWGLAAFFVGRRTTSPKRGAAAGALTLVVGVAVYHFGGALRGYVVGQADLVWTFVALVAGPVMGWSAAAIASRRWLRRRRCSWPRRSSSRSTAASGTGIWGPSRTA